MFSFLKRSREKVQDASAGRMMPAESPDDAQPAAVEPVPEPAPDDRSPEHRALLAAMLDTGAWCVDSLNEEDGVIELRGWAIAPGYTPDALGFTLNDRPFDEVLYPLQRDDLANMVWYVPEGLRCGVVCRMHARLDDVCPDGIGVLKFIVKGTGRSVRDEHDCHYDVRTDGQPLPPALLRIRVHGTADERSFRSEGYTNFIKVRNILQRIFRRDYGDFASILDWGCGCGRFLRYFEPMAAGTRITGADIDREAVAWTVLNLGFARGVTLPLHPPSALEPAAYDLIIGISIFTHLAEREQFEWLDELRRVAAPGAVLLMSVHGETAVSRRGDWPVRKLLDWRASGLVVESIEGVEGVHEEADTYKSSYHTREYLQTKWGRYFDIVEIVPGYVGNLQDLVVMVRR